MSAQELLKLFLPKVILLLYDSSDVLSARHFIAWLQMGQQLDKSLTFKQHIQVSYPALQS